MSANSEEEATRLVEDIFDGDYAAAAATLLRLGAVDETPALIHSLNQAQLNVVEHYQALNVPASWFIGETKPDGAVEVIAIGDALGGVDAFVWSFQIDKDGEHSSQEAQLTEDGFSTGIEV